MSSSRGADVVDAASLAALAASCLAGCQVLPTAARPSGWAARVHADLRAVTGDRCHSATEARSRLERLARWSRPEAMLIEQLVLPGLEARGDAAVSLSGDG